MAEDRHQQRQQRLKEQVDARIAAAQDARGLLLVFTGNGKGKTTAAFGTVTRAVGHGMKAGVIQFIKGEWPNGEKNLLQQHGVEFQVMATGFTWETQNKETDTEACQAVWQHGKRIRWSMPRWRVIPNRLSKPCHPNSITMGSIIRHWHNWLGSALENMIRVLCPSMAFKSLPKERPWKPHLSR